MTVIVLATARVVIVVVVRVIISTIVMPQAKMKTTKLATKLYIYIEIVKRNLC